MASKGNGGFAAEFARDSPRHGLRASLDHGMQSVIFLRIAAAGTQFRQLPLPIKMPANDLVDQIKLKKCIGIGQRQFVIPGGDLCQILCRNYDDIRPFDVLGNGGAADDLPGNLPCPGQRLAPQVWKVPADVFIDAEIGRRPLLSGGDRSEMRREIQFGAAASSRCGWACANKAA